MMSNAATAIVAASGAQANMVAPFNGLKSMAGFPVTRKSNGITSIASNGGRVQCMQVTALKYVIYSDRLVDLWPLIMLPNNVMLENCIIIKAKLRLYMWNGYLSNFVMLIATPVSIVTELQDENKFWANTL